MCNQTGRVGTGKSGKSGPENSGELGDVHKTSWRGTEERELLYAEGRMRKRASGEEMGGAKTR